MLEYENVKANAQIVDTLSSLYLIAMCKKQSGRSTASLRCLSQQPLDTPTSIELSAAYRSRHEQAVLSFAAIRPNFRNLGLRRTDSGNAGLSNRSISKVSNGLRYTIFHKAAELICPRPKVAIALEVLQVRISGPSSTALPHWAVVAFGRVYRLH